MAVCGKRKRLVSVRGEDDGSEDEETLRARFQRAFEAKFKPLERSETTSKKRQDLSESEEEEEDDGEDDEASDWSGLSSAGEEKVEVINYNATKRIPDEEVQRREKKAFMSSKPPSAPSNPGSSTKPSKSATDPDDNTEHTNLKHDLALQRLLKESHLLDASTFAGTGSASTTPTGKSRLKATDLRLQDLGAKTQAEKMPLAHRRGMTEKAEMREGKRRREARENGIILERERKAKAKGKGDAERARGVGGSSVGKFHGGTLKLSGRDVKAIQQSGERGGRRGRGRGRR